jgi:hypothetical protein
VGLLGERYGFVAQSGISVTEEEFLEARRRGLRILLFNQDGPKEAQQQEFLDRIRQYEEGYHLDFFTTVKELTDKVTKALFDEVAQPNVSVLDVSGAQAHFERHRSGLRRYPESNSWIAAIFLPTRQGEEYLSALELERGEIQDRLLQTALFGDGAFFRREVGNALREGANSLVIEQRDEHNRATASVELWTDGTLTCSAALGARRDRGYALVSSMVIDQEDVERLLGAFCRYADLFYRGVNRAEVIASLYVGISLTGLQYKSFGKIPSVEPNQISMPMSEFSDPVHVPQQPLKVARAELADAEQLARKLTNLTARTFRAAGRYYSPRS